MENPSDLYGLDDKELLKMQAAARRDSTMSRWIDMEFKRRSVEAQTEAAQAAKLAADAARTTSRWTTITAIFIGISGVLGKAPAAEMLTAVMQIMERLKLTVNEDKTRCLRCPDEALEFLGYRIGRNYRPKGKGAYTGTRPSKASVQSICRKISDQTAAKYGLMTPQEMVRRLNQIITGWANYYYLGQVDPAYVAIDAHATRRLRQWLCRKHKVRCGKFVRYPNGCGTTTA